MRMTIAIAASVRRSSPSVFGFGGCKRSPKSQLKMFIALILSKILIQKRTIAKIMIGRQLRLFACVSAHFILQVKQRHELRQLKKDVDASI